MISKPDASQVLQPLAAPTLTAFAESRAALASQREALGDTARCMEPAVLATLEGFAFWAPFASLLAATYRSIASVAREERDHPLEHVWKVDNRIRLHLKSEIDQLSNEQKSLEFGDEYASESALVILTWSHLGTSREEPTFIGMDQGRASWSIPVEALVVAKPADTIRPEVPKAKVNIPDLASRAIEEKQK